MSGFSGSSGLVRHFDGSDWKTVSSGAYNDIRAVWGHRAREVWLASGSTWSGRPSCLQNGGSGESFGPSLASGMDALWGWRDRCLGRISDGENISFRWK